MAAPKPAAAAGASQAGRALTIKAGDAVASTDTDGAAAGADNTIQAGSAARRNSGNANGGNVVLLPGALIGSGADGKVIVRQPGGVAGTDDVEITHTGALGKIQAASGNMEVYCETNFALVLGNAGSGDTYINGNPRVGKTLFFSDSDKFGAASAQSTLVAVASGVLAPMSSVGTAGGQMEFKSIADIGTPSTDSSRIAAEADPSELVVCGEDGTETIISPHAKDGPPEVYDDIPGVELVTRSINRFANTVVYHNHTRAAMCAETGERKKCRFVETLATYNARTGRNKAPLDWDAVQDQKQAKHEAEVAAENQRAIDLVSQQNTQGPDRIAAKNAHVFETWVKSGSPTHNIPVPKVWEPIPLPTPKVANDIRKQKPKWMKEKK